MRRRRRKRSSLGWKRKRNGRKSGVEETREKIIK